MKKPAKCPKCKKLIDYVKGAKLSEYCDCGEGIQKKEFSHRA